MKNWSSGKQRIFSSIIIAIVLLPILFFQYYIVGVVALLAVIAFTELLHTKKNKAGTLSRRGLTKVKDGWGWPVWIVLFAAFIYLGAYQAIDFMNGHLTNGAEFNILEPTQILVGVFSIYALSVFSPNFDSDDAGYVVSMMIIIVSGLRALIWLTFDPTLTTGPEVYFALPIIFVVLSTFAGDTWAYVCGRAFGKHKMIPRVSPKKTWEGAIGGFTLTLATGVAIHYGFNFDANVVWPLWFSVVMAGSIMIVGAIGDLVFSRIKRDHGIKDFSNLLPGHGGVLDRFDAMVFTATFFYVIFNLCITTGVF